MILGPWIAHHSPGSFGSVVKEETFIDISLFSYSSSVFQRRGTICANMVEDSCEIILNLDQWFRMRYFKEISYIGLR